jgi:hypothetical protein
LANFSLSSQRPLTPVSTSNKQHSAEIGWLEDFHLHAVEHARHTKGGCDAP